MRCYFNGHLKGNIIQLNLQHRMEQKTKKWKKPKSKNGYAQKYR